MHSASTRVEGVSAGVAAALLVLAACQGTSPATPSVTRGPSQSPPTPSLIPSVAATLTPTAPSASPETGPLTTSAAMRSIGPSGAIVFYRTDDARSANTPFIIDPSGSNEAQLVDDLVTGVWSPDGSRLVFAQLVPDPSPLPGAETAWIRPAIVNADGSDFRVLDAYPNRKIQLVPQAWSADGSRIYVYSGDEDVDSADVGLFTVRSSDGGDLSRIPLPGRFSPGRFSPDGSSLLLNIVEPRDGMPDLNTLFIANADGTNELQLSPLNPDITVIGLEFFGGTSEDWSPDGSLVAFCAAFTDEDQTGLHVVNPDGSGLKQIVSSDIGAISARFSPDGQEIAFTAEDGLEHEIWTVNPDGTGLKQLTNGAGDGWVSIVPIWSPDGTRLLFQRKHFAPGAMTRFQQPADVTLWTINADGTDLRQLSPTPLATDWVGPYAWWPARAK